MDRRKFIKWGGIAIPIAGVLSVGVIELFDKKKPKAETPSTSVSPKGEKADYTIRIATGLIEVGPQHIISTTTYNGQFPGPLLRFKEGRRTIVDIYNDTDVPEQFHWHGQFLSTAIDGAVEEKTPYIPARGMRREVFEPKPSGFRFYHTHLAPGANLNAGQYTGEVGPVYIEPKNKLDDYDREEFIVLKEFDPYFMRGGDMAKDFLSGEAIEELKAMEENAGKKHGTIPGPVCGGAPQPGKKDGKEVGAMPKGYEVGYKIFTINGNQLGHGAPVSVKKGERILFHILNGSATEIRSLALPGHTFKVVALDGNPVPNAAEIPVLWIGTAERISAIVEMNGPGAWIMGDLDDDDRGNGMGIVVEYEGHKGDKPQWLTPKPFKWDYCLFGKPNGNVQKPDEIIEMLFAKQNGADKGFNRWTINGKAFDMMDMAPMFHLKEGKRYRLHMRNASDDIHPMHLHRHSFEITKIGGKATSGIIKDVVMLGGFQEADIDFTANNPGLTLFHCHMQIHMDFGFMAVFDYV
jgi:FtsP/CotA-like multicopper oxidase with cupredoxin domain